MFSTCSWVLWILCVRTWSAMWDWYASPKISVLEQGIDKQGSKAKVARAQHVLLFFKI